MPSLLDIGLATAPALAGSLINRNATGDATRAITGGLSAAGTSIAQSEADRQALLKQTLANQQAQLNPYQTAGLQSLDMLKQGVQPGGGLADPYGKSFSWAPADLANDPGFQFRLNEGLKAIKAASNAGGIRFSGATLKSVDKYAAAEASQEAQNAFNRDLTTFNSNENTFRQNQADRYNRVMGVTQIGQNATNQNVGAQGDYARTATQSSALTAQQLADLETEKASAIASGDLGKAKSITDAIAQGAGAVAGLPAADYIKSLMGTAGVGALTAGGAGTAEGALGVSAGSLGISPAAAPMSVGAVAGGAAPLTGYAGGGLVTSHGALIGAATNPITLGIAGGIIAITSLLKSQAHHEADTFVQTLQNPFDKAMGTINQQFFTAAQNGQLTRDQAVQYRNEVEAAANAYEAKLKEFSSQGKDEKKVASQAQATADKYYGPGFSKTLNAMDGVIAGLA